MRKKTFIVVLFLVLLLSSCYGIDEEEITYNNDISINDTIGYDGFVLYLDELKRNNPNMISVDVGYHIQGGTLG